MRTARCLLLVASVGSVVACSSAGAGAPSAAGQAGTAAVRSTVYVVDAAHAADAVVASDHVAFPAASHPEMMNHVHGDVLAGEKGGAQNPWGFLRKVTGFPKQVGDQIVIPTAPATLLDAVSQASFHATLQAPKLTTSGPVVTNAMTVHPMDITGGTTTQLLDFSGTKLLDASDSVKLPSGDTIGYAAHATVKQGTLDFSPSFDVGADIEPNLTDPLSSVKEAHVIATGALAAALELDVGMALTGNMNGDDLAQLIATRVLQAPSATLADYPVDLGTISVGILNIPVHAEFKATLACDLSYGGGLGVDVGGKATGSVTAGFRYEGGSLTPVVSHSESFEMIGPTWTMDSAVHVRCSVKPEFDLSFYDLAAGSVWAEPHVSLDAAAVCSQAQLTGTVSGSAQAGIDAVASAKVDIFGLYTWDKECTLFDAESPTAAVSETFPLPGGSNTACTSNPPPSNPAVAPLPPSCFGGGSGSSGGTASGGTTPAGGSTSGGPTSTGPAPTPDAGPPNDGGGDVCDHDACTAGDALSASCTKDSQGGACIAAICKNDPYCCQFTWSVSCIAHLTNGDYGCTKNSCP